MGDTAGQGLSYVAAKANIKVTNKDGSVVLKENTDYKIQNSENGFVIDFIVNNGQVSDTVASLHGQDLQMTYNMYVNDSAAVANPLTNSVDFVYNNNPFNQEEHHEKTKADVVTYGAKFLKVDSGLFGIGIKATPLEGAEFAAKNAEGKYYGGLVDTDKDGVKEAVWVDDVANAAILKSDKEGHFEITGLTEGKYSLEETKAPENYQKLTKEISFKVDKDSYKEENRITIKNNQKASVPMTGSNGFQTYVLISCLLLGAGYFLQLFTLRRKPRRIKPMIIRKPKKKRIMGKWIIAFWLLSAVGVLLLMPAEAKRVAKYQQNQQIAAIDRTGTAAETDSSLDVAKIELGDPVGILTIPSISLKLPIYDGTSDKILENGVGITEGTGDITGGNGKNPLIAGHSGLYKDNLFDDLPSVKKGKSFISKLMVSSTLIKSIGLRKCKRRTTKKLCHLLRTKSQ